MQFVPHFARLAVVSALLASVWSVGADLDSDMQTVRSRYVDEMTSGKFDPEKIQSSLAAQKPDGSFRDIDYANKQVNDAWQPALHLTRLEEFTKAYLSSDPVYQKSAKLKAAIHSGIAFWLAKDFQNKNWFWNQIGVPGRLVHPLLVFYDDLNDTQKAQAIAILSRAKVEGSGTNFVWQSEITVERGLLEKDVSLVRSTFERLAADIHLTSQQKDGQQADGSFLFHGPLLYTWGYGSYELQSNSRLMRLVAGTAFAFPDEKIRGIRDWTLDGAQWLARGPGADFGGEGREISRKGQTAGILVDIGKDLLKANVGREKELAEMIARTQADPAAPALVGNRGFWRADMMAHHRPGYYVSARLYSARTRNTEWGNGEALRSFYIADGATVLMRDGREYVDIYPVWDWQHVPGTTVEALPDFGKVAGKEDDAPDGFFPNRNGIIHGTKETFVGGVSDGQYGVFGGRFSRDSLTVHRGWFFFDDQYVCLGAGLACGTDNAVNTTLDQCYLRGNVTAMTGTAPFDVARGEHDIDGLRWVMHDSVGYLFDSPVRMHVDNHAQTGSWRDISTAYPPVPVSHDVFKAYIDHGSHPTDASFAFTVFPKTDSAAMTAAAAMPPAKIASNTAECQAVWQQSLGRGGAIFYVAGSAELRPGLKVTVDQPSMLLVAITASGASVSVSNPENKPAAVHVKIEADGKSAEADITLPDGVLAGSSVTQAMAF